MSNKLRISRRFDQSRLTRRRFIAATAWAIASGVAVACGGDGDAAGGDAPASVTGQRDDRSREETLRVALTGEPPNLDLHQTTDSIVLLVCSHMYETLFTWDSDYNPVPLLAESHDIIDGGLVNEVTIRDDVRFHNGEPLRSDDVVASVERWMTTSSLGSEFADLLLGIEPMDDTTLRFEMSRPYGAFRTVFSRQLQGCAIYPRSVIETSNSRQLSEYVGTGPYMMKEWLPDRHIKLDRFSAYRSAGAQPDGYAGRKQAFFQAIDLAPVRNEASRVAGMQAGDYHFVESLSTDQAPVLKSDKHLEVETLPADSWLNVVLNLRSPLCSDLRIRRAIQFALDHEQIMLAAVGKGFYELTPELLPGAPIWYSDAGSELFNPFDPEHAKQLLIDAGYDDEPLRMMTTQEVQQEYNATLTIRQQLEQIGFTIDLQIYDGATLSDRRNDQDAWDTYTAWASFRPDPIMRNLTSAATGWWENTEKEALLETLQTATDQEKRIQAWHDVQRLFYEDVPRLKIGNTKRLLVRAETLRDVGPTEMQPEFSNAWLDE